MLVDLMVTFDKCSDHAFVTSNGLEVGIFFLGKYPYFLPYKNHPLSLELLKEVTKLGEDFIKEREKTSPTP